MTLKKAISLSIAVSLLGSGETLCQGFWDGNDLYKYCGSENMPDKTVCTAYVVGAVDVFVASRKLCFPKNFIIKEAADIVINYLRDHPEGRHYAAVSEIAMALRNFHCEKSD
jgi:hypothetical protein